ncbi:MULTISPECIES: NACHT domain-containing protein [unclassified Kribbella]|uniref:NACHT domain-containing protein n=1 Tax=unclassified Kribbella TaxID=2644121 RepID=UPI0030173444
MALSPYTFSGAVALLDSDRKASGVLDKILGGAIFVGTGAALVAGGPVAGLSAAAWLALVDPKNEVSKLLAPLVNKVYSKLKGTNDKSQLELIAAAHTITVLSSYFDALKEMLGGVHAELALTDKDRARLSASGAGDDPFTGEIPLPSPQLGVTENLEQNLIPYFERLAQRTLDFFTGLHAWSRTHLKDQAHLADGIVQCAAAIYTSRMLELSPSPPFALWLTLNEFAATRGLITTQAAAMGELRTMLTIALRGRPAPGDSYRKQLALAAQEVLDEPLLRSSSRTVASPTVRDGFVGPAFQHALADDQSQPADEEWWDGEETHESLVDYLAGYLASESSTERPLLLLGHPGAGKSLLTEVLAAQLPTDSFAVVRVPLRSVNPDDELAIQINKELQRALLKPHADLEELQRECGPCDACVQTGHPAACTHRARLVVLLDGFDELVQATGATQSGYLTKIEAFQKRARTLGSPTSVIVTSRTVVADRAEIPTGTSMIKLCEFDDTRIRRWLSVWNAAHSQIPGFSTLDLEGLTGQEKIAELARQPLLLLMLAVYLAELGTNQLGGADLTQSTLYQRILNRFITRQVTEKTAPDAPENEQRRLETEQRRHLQYAAIGMFNRGRQHITDGELDADLNALEPRKQEPTAIQALSPAHRVLGEFMFVHNAKADRDQRAAYEFLHATFGEFLVAELVMQLLSRLMRYRELEATDPGLHAGQLDDSLLRRLLSHQPLSTRLPTLIFASELANDLTPPQHQSLLATITELLQAELFRPDTGDELYSPLPYDPVRRRACYTANLTLLRVLLDHNPVPVEEVVGTTSRDQWERVVRLWRAGLDNQAWVSIMHSLGTVAHPDVPPDALLLTRRIFSEHEVAVNEAELLGDRLAMAIMLTGAPGTLAVDDRWSDADLTTINNVARILFTTTGTPHLGELLPFDLEWYESLIANAGSRRSPLNNSVKRAILILLSRVATDLPHDYIRRLLALALPPPGPLSYGPELAAVVAAKPALLEDVPELRGFIADVEAGNASAVVAFLWYAEQRSNAPERGQLQELRHQIDLRLIDELPFSFNSGYFAPEFVTYLRLERPEHWIGNRHGDALFEDIEPDMLASIAPEDALYLMEIWPSLSFLEAYLEGRGIDREPDTPLLDVLEAYAAANPSQPFGRAGASGGLGSGD